MAQWGYYMFLSFMSVTSAVPFLTTDQGAKATRLFAKSLVREKDLLLSYELIEE